MPNVELTEFTELDPDELHLVKRGANGFPALLAKSVAEEIEAAKSDSPEADAQEELMTTETQKSSSDEADDQLEDMTDEVAKSLCFVPDCEVCAPKLAKAKLKAKQRRALPKSAFAIPSKAPKSGSYPINDESHARNALSRAAGKPEEAQVRAAVRRKFPNIGAKKSPGVPDFATATPREAGFTRDTGVSGRRIADMTAGPVHLYDDPSFHGAGETPYILPNEAKIDPRNPVRDDTGRVDVPNAINRAHQGTELTKAEEYGITLLLAAMQREQLRKQAGDVVIVENATAPGTPDWDDLDSTAQLDSALSMVARLAFDGLGKADEEMAEKADLRSARQRLTDVFGEPINNTGDTGSQKETITVETTPAELASSIVTAVEKTFDERAKEAKKAAKKAAKKQAKKAAKEEAKKVSNNKGDVTLGDMQSGVNGRADADDVGTVGNGRVDTNGVTAKETKDKRESLKKQVKELSEKLAKVAAQPRSGGPILDGQARGTQVSADGQSGMVLKGSDGHEYSIPDIDTLRKQLEEELGKRGPEAAQRASQLGYELTRAQLLAGHARGEI